jgi:hypothetical protein
MKVPLYAVAGVATSCVAFLFGYVHNPESLCDPSNRRG